MSEFGLKIPPTRIVELPVSANLTGTTEPTERWSLFAVVVSMRSSRRARALAPAPADIRRMTVSDKLLVESAVRLGSESRNWNSPLYTVETVLTPGTREADAATELLNSPDPALLALVTMYWALMALSTRSEEHTSELQSH